MTALFLSNGRIAPLVATALALMANVLFIAGILPWLQYTLASCWGRSVGFVVFCACLLCWQPRKTIFMDVLCINQYDAKQKGMALFSMPAFLKASESLLVLWDPSYTRRLWCCFEIAAFLHSRDSGQKARVTVRPTLLGPVFISLPIGLTFVVLSMGFAPVTSDRKNHNHAVMWPMMALFTSVGFYWSVAKLREFFRSVDSLHHELQQFRCNDCLCHCCSAGHRSPGGFRMACDRRVLLSCITLWFGSVENFESLVRSEVLSCLTEQLTSHVLTYKQFAVMALPVLWHYLDTASEPLEYILHPRPHKVWVLYELLLSSQEVIRGIGWAFCSLPILFFVTSKLTCWLRNRAGRSERMKMCSDILINCSILLIVIAIFMALLALEQVCFNLDSDRYRTLLALTVYFALQFLFGLLLFKCIPVKMGLQPVETSLPIPTAPGIAHAICSPDAVTSDVDASSPPRPPALSARRGNMLSL